MLLSLGFSFEKARACVLPAFESVDGISLKPLRSVDLRNAKEKFGASFMSIHRVDLQKELLRLVSEGSDSPIELRLGTAAEPIYEEDEVSVRTSDGIVHKADLIIGADGIHSGMRKAVLGPSYQIKCLFNMSLYRFLLPTSKIEGVDKLKKLLAWKPAGSTVFVDTTETVDERHFVWYPCRECV